GRTCKITALRFSEAALSIMAVNSSFCLATDRPGSEGQSILATVATQTPRNSRGVSGTLVNFSTEAGATGFGSGYSGSVTGSWGVDSGREPGSLTMVLDELHPHKRPNSNKSHSWMEKEGIRIKIYQYPDGYR